MATKPKAILSTHDGREASPITRASNVLFENGQTAQDILNDRQDAMISPVIENSSSMFKVGQGDNVDYSSNVVNGAYESMVLKGKTMVNCIQEPSSKDVVLPYEFADGHYVTINDTKESGALGVELKGQTLVNCIDDDMVDASNLTKFNHCYNSSQTYEQVSNGIKATTSGEGFTLIGFDAHSSKLNKKQFIKLNTNYYVVAKVSDIKQSEGSTNTVRINMPSITRRDEIVSDGYIHCIGKITEYAGNLAWIYMGFSTSNTTLGDTFTLNGMSVYEISSEDVNKEWSELEQLYPYGKTGMASCKMPILHTVGKNLLNNVTVTDGWVNITNIFKKNTTYILSADINNQSNVDARTRLNIHNYDGTISYYGEVAPSGYSGRLSTKICHTKDFYKAELVTRQYFHSSPEGVCDIANYQLELATSATTYEQHKSSILSLPEEVVLRSLPNGVCDTFNTRTGEYVQRIGEITLDGNTRHTFNNNNSDNVNVFYFDNIVPNKKFTGYAQESQRLIQCDSLKTGLNFNRWDSTESEYSLANTATGFWIFVPKSIPQSWLAQNPVAVQYELATPIVTKVNLPSTLKSWNTTTHFSSEIPENTLYPTLTHSNPTYPVILKPSTKYSIVANSYSNNHTNSTINFNLGGATASTTVGNRVTTITTPSTLSNELLTMSGRGNKLNNVMVIEGDVVGDEPYFEGICDCKSPILSNVGKNLFDDNEFYRSWKNSNASYIYEEVVDGEKVFRVFDGSALYYSGGYEIRVKRGQRYTFKITLKQYNSAESNNVIILQNGETRVGNHAHAFYCNSSTWATREVTFVAEEDFIRIGSGYNSGNYFYAKDMILAESSSVNSYEPYKSNILSCNGDKINLTEGMFEQGSIYFSSGSTFASMTQNVDGARIRTKNLLSLNPNISYSVSISNDYYFTLSKYNGEQRGHSETGWTQNVIITPTSDMKDFGVVIRKADNRAIATSEFNQSKFQIREVDKTIVLRSLPSGACDTLNVETGEYVQRIGEVVLDGTKRFGRNMPESEYSKPCVRVSCGSLLVNGSNAPNFNMKADKIAIGHYSYDLKYPVMAGLHEQALYIYIPRTIIGLATNDNDAESIANAFNSWLTQNPITVQYPLATPIVTTIDMQGFPYAYTNGHVQLSSGSIEQSLTPKVEYSVATNRNGQIRSNQKMVERHQKQLDQLQAIVLANLVNSQYNQTLTTLKYELSRV